MEKKTAKKSTKTSKAEKVAVVFKGKYISAIGRRKKSISRVRLYKKGDGTIRVNDFSLEDYFSATALRVIKQPLKLTGHLDDFNISIICRGGGKLGQAHAARHGISRALVEFDPEYKPSLRAKGWVTRDARRKERKKPGLKKARRAPQWSKR